jgi:hypothetical protein
MTDYVRRLLDETREEFTRADTKASIVLAGAGAGVAVGILIAGFATGDLSLAGQRWYVGALAWIARATLVGGVICLGSAVYPRTKGAHKGHARWFGEIAQFGTDEDKLSDGIDRDAAEGPRRDVHQTRALAAIVRRKYTLTKVGMWLLGVGLAAAGLAALLGK